MRNPFKAWRRRRLAGEPFPEAWRRVLARNVPYVAFLTEKERRELERLVRVFLAEKTFEGAGGFEVDDEARITIAGQACLLLLNRGADVYPRLDTVIVYPAAYVAPGRRRNPDGTVTEGPQVRFGESWKTGAVVLSWEDVRRGAEDFHDGRNLVLHEFAHQIDSEDGPADGAPPLSGASSYAAWARVLGREYRALLTDVQRLRPTVLDGYGATNPAEFFAVATETFFERSRELRARSPELYDQLRLFYRQDPAARIDAAARGKG
ncbi:MAG: zinc-dependent peptidase [Candidatus Eisenbacteria bacterium]|nr:zinc-dependent peptidase [Candidatus Eisenbacteria bacterium]